uniref:hypothetical protein n=1 Tax=Candidatus Similichlamydia epinepheli TaxID=1903953 RepID=UPI001300BBD9
GRSFILHLPQSRKTIFQNLASRNVPLHSAFPGFCVRRFLLKYSLGLLFTHNDPNQEEPHIRSILIGMSFWPFLSAADAHRYRNPELPIGRCVSLNLLPIILALLVAYTKLPTLCVLFFAYLFLIWYETTPFDAVRPRDIHFKEEVSTLYQEI